MQFRRARPSETASRSWARRLSTALSSSSDFMVRRVRVSVKSRFSRSSSRSPFPVPQRRASSMAPTASSRQPARDLRAALGELVYARLPRKQLHHRGATLLHRAPPRPAPHHVLVPLFVVSHAPASPDIWGSGRPRGQPQVGRRSRARRGPASRRTPASTSSSRTTTSSTSGATS
jgi:hypothetical protein